MSGTGAAPCSDATSCSRDRGVGVEPATAIATPSAATAATRREQVVRMRHDQNILLSTRMSQPGLQVVLDQAAAEVADPQLADRGDSTTFWSLTSRGRTTPVSTTIWRSPLMSISRTPSSTRSPFGSTSTTRAVMRRRQRAAARRRAAALELRVRRRAARGSSDRATAAASSRRRTVWLTPARGLRVLVERRVGGAGALDALDDADGHQVVDGGRADRGRGSRSSRSTGRRPAPAACAAPTPGSARRARRRRRSAAAWPARSPSCRTACRRPCRRRRRSARRPGRRRRRD